MNNQILGLFDGDYITYLSDDSVETEDDGRRLNFTIEFLNSINPPGVPQHPLRLKVGIAVMLLRHLNTKKGLCDRNKLAINSVRDNVIETRLIKQLESEGIPALVSRYQPLVEKEDDGDSKTDTEGRSGYIEVSASESLTKPFSQFKHIIDFPDEFIWTENGDATLLRKHLKTSFNNMRLFHMNIRSLDKNFNHLNVLLEQIVNEGGMEENIFVYYDNEPSSSKTITIPQATINVPEKNPEGTERKRERQAVTSENVNMGYKL
nr:unnamed protein product [Callosobruchus analis]